MATTTDNQKLASALMSGSAPAGDTYQSLNDYMNNNASPYAYTGDQSNGYQLDLSHLYNNANGTGVYSKQGDAIKQYTGIGDGTKYGTDQQVYNMYNKDGTVTQGADASMNDGWLNKHFDQVVLAAVAAMGGGAAMAGMGGGAGVAAGEGGTTAGTTAGTVAGDTSLTALPAGGMTATGGADVGALGSGFSGIGDASVLSPDLLGTGLAGSMPAAAPFGYTLGGSVMAGAPGTLSSATGLGSAPVNFANTGVGLTPTDPWYQTPATPNNPKAGEPSTDPAPPTPPANPLSSSLLQKLIPSLLKLGAGGAASGGVGGSGASGFGASPNEMLNQTPGMIAATNAPAQQNQAIAQALLLGNPAQPKFNAINYGSLPQGNSNG